MKIPEIIPIRDNDQFAIIAGTESHMNNISHLGAGSICIYMCVCVWGGDKLNVILRYMKSDFWGRYVAYGKVHLDLSSTQKKVPSKINPIIFRIIIFQLVSVLPNFPHFIII